MINCKRCNHWHGNSTKAHTAPVAGRITIKQNEYDEYEVPTGVKDDGITPAIYYTDDKGDAFDTARRFHGIIADITFRRGTYGVEE